MDDRLLHCFVTVFVLAVSGCASAPRDKGGAIRPIAERGSASDQAPQQERDRSSQAPSGVPPQGIPDGTHGTVPRTAPADVNDVMTLAEALSLALMHNPELRASSLEVGAAQARALQVSLWPNPELGLEVEQVGGTGQRRGFDGSETTLQLSQLVELGGKRGKRTTVASLEKDMSQWDYEAKRLEVFSTVVKAFVEALAAQARVRLAEDMQRLSGELVETVSQRVEAGKDSPVEKAKAAVVLADARIRRQQALEDLELSRKRLSATWGSTTPRFKSVSGLPLLTPVPAIEELSGLIERHPVILRSSLAVDRQKAALELEKAKAVSDVTLSGGLQRFEEDNDNAVVFGVSLPLPISDRNQGGRLEATYNLARARQEDRAIRTSLEMELAAAYQSLSNAHIEVTELDADVLQNAESLFNAAREGYGQGKLDYLDLLDAQRTLFEVRARYIEALRSYHLAKAEVERLIRRDLKTLAPARQTRARPR